jgi:hypothetical protein
VFRFRWPRQSHLVAIFSTGSAAQYVLQCLILDIVGRVPFTLCEKP